MKRFSQFELNLGRARELIGLGESIASLSASRLDSTDLYRSALVQGVAALDTYVHGVVVDLAVDTLLGRRQAGSSGKIGFDFGTVSDLLGASSDLERELRARTHVAARLSKETFQRPDAIGQAFSMVGMPKIWTAALGDEAGDRILALSLIVRRRNHIVHSCDADQSLVGRYQSMDSTDASSALTEIKFIVGKIDLVV